MNKADFVLEINKHQGILHKICRLYRDGKEDREDLFQEIVFQLWKAWPGYKGTARLGTWMYRIALNTAMASFRKKKPDIAFTGMVPDREQERPDEAAAFQREQLFAAMKKLDDSEKAILTLYLEALSYRQIAEIIGISENHVGVKLNRIKNKIQKLLIQ